MPARRFNQITYFDWLLDKCENDYEPGGAGTHKLLLRKLYELEFYAVLERDNDSIEHGFELRNKYDECRMVPWDEPERYNKPCSVLEVMVSMCDYLEVHIMSNELYGNRFGKWFWMMIENCGLSFLNDQSWTFDASDYVTRVISNICDRRYEANGDGSFFPLRNPRGDMTKTDLWYQMQWYITENFSGSW